MAISPLLLLKKGQKDVDNGEYGDFGKHQEFPMIPADDPRVDYRELVRRGYDACAEEYGASRRSQAGDEIRGLLERLEDGASVLDVGCGAGVPIAQALSRRYRITGVDMSEGMVRLARRNVPEGEFVCGDVMSVEFEEGSFDAVVAFYSIFHLPREEHGALFRRIWQWLKPGGYFLCTLSRRDEEAYTEDDFFGVTMFWSNFELSKSSQMLREVGFEVVEVSSTAGGWADEDESAKEDHPLVLVRRR